MKFKDLMGTIKFDTHIWIKLRTNILDFSKSKSYMIFHYSADYYNDDYYNKVVELYDLKVVLINVSSVYYNCIEVVLLKESDEDEN